MKNKRKLQNVKLNFKKDDNMKNKKTIIIVIIILLLVLVGVTTALVLKPKKASTTNNNYNSIEKKLSSTKEIKGNVATNKIILETTSNIDTTKKVHLWIFSDPIDLGEFSIIKEENTYSIENINAILKTKNIKAGSHKILIIQNDQAIGYLNVELTSVKTLKITIIEDQKDESQSEETKTEEETTENNTTNNQQNNNNQPTEPSQEVTPTQPIQEEVKCTPKKFKNKYTYVFTEKEVCVKSGDQIDAWDYFRANNIPATIYGCEEIVDDCGDTYYGVYYGNTSGERFYY